VKKIVLPFIIIISVAVVIVMHSKKEYHSEEKLISK
jgi:hypothetical protein